MICEYCGIGFAEMPKDRRCPGCGAPVSVRKGPKFPAPPIGVYKNAGGSWIEITEDSVKFHIETGTEAQERTIPYIRLHKVVFKGSKKLIRGERCLSVQAWEDRYDKIVDTFWKVWRDKTASSIMFDPKRVDEFAMVADFLQKCAEIANAAREEK